MWHLPAGSVALPSPVGKKMPPALTLLPDTSVPPCMPLVPSKLLPWCWSSEGVSLSKSMCGFFKRNCLGSQQFLYLTPSLMVFAARSYGDLFSWYWNPGMGRLVWGQESSLPRYLSQIFIHHTQTWDQPVSAPLTSLHGCGFLNSAVIGLPFN